YGAEPSQFGDLRLPAGAGPHPCAVVIHGGFWRARYDLEHIGHLCRALAGAGVATWNLEYRRVGEPGGGWPGTFRDVAWGAGFLFEVAPRYGIDAERVVVLGHSAGGHLALWLASGAQGTDDPDLDRGMPLRFRGVVALAGVSNLRLAWALGLSDRAVEGLLGGTPEEVPDRYAGASPRELVPLGVRQVLIHGDEDENVPVAVSEGYRAAAVAAGDDVELVVLPGTGHFEPVDPESGAWPAVLGAVTTLVGR
ncbi:MAG: alpha/beta fold hydrolase, partial [Chloroflexota bacterium]|nr:alpha/beta fold hydrolase [Chloroflexota bacterium]